MSYVREYGHCPVHLKGDLESITEFAVRTRRTEVSADITLYGNQTNIFLCLNGFALYHCCTVRPTLTPQFVSLSLCVAFTRP
jgi:hypothetical protein